MHAHLLHLLSDFVWLSRDHVNLVEHRHNRQVLVKGQEKVCNSLSLQGEGTQVDSCLT